jgi:hypothetical protein
MANGSSLDIRFSQLVHWYGTLNADDGTHFFKSIHKGKPVDYRCEHAHRIPGRAVNAFVASLQTSEDIASSDNQADLNPHVSDGLDFLADSFE